jgi:hypothetical protein
MDAIENLSKQYEECLTLASQIANLHIENWLADLSHAESVGPRIDPTLYRKYIYSRKPAALKRILLASLALKQVVQDVRDEVASNPEAYV